MLKSRDETVDALLERSNELKQALSDFILDADGEIAEALETYAAEELRKGSGDSIRQELTIESFITEGKIGDKSPLDFFIEAHPKLSESDRTLLKSWCNSFTGLFAITKILPDGFELMNWLTAKHYIVKPNESKKLQEMSRLKEGEILLTRISPVTENYWTFSGPYTQMGKLGKPKLAVAIGNFKENYKNYLYSDAPELLEEAWRSVEKYHQHFVDFFGSDQVTMPGYQLNKKIAELQEIITKESLAAAGIDSDKSLAEIAQEAGVGQEEIEAAAAEMGADSKAVSQLFDSKSTTDKMVMPKVDLPAEIKKAEAVTTLTHPRWGQMFLPTYSKIQAILTADDWQSVEGAEKLIRHYLENVKINAYIWQHLAVEYPNQLEKILQTILQRPEFQLERDLNALLQEFNKALEPELPEIASVPLHLHSLFQEAIAEVHKSKPKAKGNKKTTKGFQ